jgi:hypothetical protein
MCRGDREERLAAEADSSAYDEVAEALVDPVSGIEVIDALLHHPDADTLAVGCGPLEDLLSQTPSVAPDVAIRCRTDAAWREAASHVVLDRAPDVLAQYVRR